MSASLYVVRTDDQDQVYTLVIKMPVFYIRVFAFNSSSDYDSSFLLMQTRSGSTDAARSAVSATYSGDLH